MSELVVLVAFVISILIGSIGAALSIVIIWPKKKKPMFGPAAHADNKRDKDKRKFELILKYGTDIHELYAALQSSKEEAEKLAKKTRSLNNAFEDHICKERGITITNTQLLYISRYSICVTSPVGYCITILGEPYTLKSTCLYCGEVR